MLKAILVKPKQFILEDVSIPPIKEGEILAKVIYSGICGSDLHSFIGGNPFAQYPVALGHEFVGKVEQVGSHVKNIKNDDLITAEPSDPCNKCIYCKRGDYHLCNNRGPWYGSFSEFIIVKEKQIYKIPNNLDLKKSVFIEPLAFAVHAMKVAKLKKNDEVLIFGAGPIGQLIARVSKLYGARNVSIIDMVAEKLRIARDGGVDEVILVGKNTSFKDLSNNIKKDNIDIVFDCVVNEFSINSSINLVKRNGKVVVIGVSSNLIPTDLYNLMSNEVEIFGCLMYKNNFEESINLLSNNKIVVSDLISDVFKLENIQDVFNNIITNKDKYLKCLIES